MVFSNNELMFFHSKVPGKSHSNGNVFALSILFQKHVIKLNIRIFSLHLSSFIFVFCFESFLLLHYFLFIP